MRLKGKTTIITGCSRGLGKSLVAKFASEGSDIFAHSRIPNDKFEEELNQLSNEYKVKITPIYFDMTDTNSMKTCISHIMKSKVIIDILINNAGIAHGGLFQMTPIPKMKEVFDVNLFATLELTQLVAKLMVRNKNGSIINIASISGLDLAAGNCAYGVSKAALIAATKTLAAELTPLGIRVNAIAPGLLNTDMADLMEQKAYDDMIGRSLMKRLGQPEEVANVAAFLASSEASFISGQIIRVDGGDK